MSALNTLEAMMAGGPPQYFPGQQIAGFNPFQQAGWGAGLGAAQGMIGAAQPMADWASQLAGQYSGGAFDINSWANQGGVPTNMAQWAGQNGVPTDINQWAASAGGPMGSLMQSFQGMLGQGLGDPELMGMFRDVLGDMTGGGSPWGGGGGWGGGSKGYEGPAITPEQINAIGPSMDFFDNPALQKAMDTARQQMTTGWRESVLPELASQGVSAGGLGGSRQGIAEGVASGKFMENLDAQMANMALDAYKTGQQGYLADRGTTVQNYIDARNAEVAAATQRYTAGASSSAAGAQAAQQARASMLGNAMSAITNMYGSNIGAQSSWMGNQLGDVGNLMAQMMGNQTSLSNNMVGTQAGLAGSMMGDQTALQNNWLGAMPGIYDTMSQGMMMPWMLQGQAAGMLSGIGDQMQAFDQARIEADMNAWNYAQNAPAAWMGQLAGLYQGFGFPGYGTSKGEAETPGLFG